MIRLVVGLGNPGPRYASTRHNLGFRVVDLLARQAGARFRRGWGYAAARLGPELGGGTLLKPLTFMNNSGGPVAQAVGRHRLDPSQVLVILDDLDLPLGRLRLRPGGSSAGHRGLKSVLAALGTSAVPRLRLGIGRPPPGEDPVRYVLSPCGPSEERVLTGLVDDAARVVREALVRGLEEAMNGCQPGAR